MPMDGGFARVWTLDIVARGIFIVQGDRLADKARCQVAAANLLGDDAKKMQAVKMVRVNREQFSVAVFGFGILAGLMMPLTSC
jgi:hypothetical protein